jgi:integrase
MRWSEVDLEARLWTLPGDRAKNHRTHVVPLAEPVHAIVAAQARRAGADGKLRDLIFGSGEGPFSGWSNCKEILDRRIAEMAGQPLTPWVVHDLRRTFSTCLHDDLGIAPHIVEACLNHISGHRGGVAGRYNKAEYLNEKRQALAMWAETLLALAEGREPAVTPLHRAR